MLDYKFWRNLRHKKDRTEVEDLLLELKNSVGTVSEILVSYSKQEYSSPERALEEIRMVTIDVVNKM
jgi:hypothetical protein